MEWFRFYDEVVNDPKVQRLSGDLFKTWVNLLCLASQNTQRGYLPDRLEDVAWVLRTPVAEVEQSILALRQAGLLDWVPERTCYQMHGWHGRQFASDNSTERVRKHRAKQEQNDETLQQRSGNAPEQSRYRTDSEQIDRSDPRAGARGNQSIKKNGGTQSGKHKPSFYEVMGEIAREAADLDEGDNIRRLPPRG